MQVAIEIIQHVTWQIVALVSVLVFYRPVARFLDRASEINVGKKGVSAKASLPDVPKAGELKTPATASSEPPHTIEAQHFVLRSPDGTKRAELGITNTNSALLVLYDGSVRSRVALYAGEHGASVLSFLDKHEQPRVMLAASEPADGSRPDEVTAGFSMRDGKGNIVTSLLVDAAGNPAIDLYSPSGVSLFDAQ